MISACEATCETHPHVTIVHFCPACRGSQGGTTGGKSTSAAKRAASKKNGARPKRPRDPNQRAKLIVDMATGEKPNDSPKRRAR